IPEIEIVVKDGDIDRSAACRLFGSAHRFLCAGYRSRRRLQQHLQPGAPAGPIGGMDLPLVLVNDSGRDSQPKPRSLGIEAARNESVKDAREYFAGNAGSVILDRYPDPALPFPIDLPAAHVD